MSRSTLFSFFFCSFFTSNATAFVSPPAGTRRFSIHRKSFLLRYSNEDNDTTNNDFVEGARASFEKLLDDNKSSIRKGIIAQAETKRLFLTETGRYFRKVEMDLLRSLADSDAALEELVHLWTTERHPSAAADIFAMQQKCSEGLVLEEARLWQMAREHPGWAEPFCRLASLLFHKGPAHYPQAATLAKRALELKPWHFEALNLLVAICQHENDAQAALAWGRRALPALGSGDASHKLHRRQWVEWALHEAKLQLDEAEHTTSAIYKNEKPRFIMEDAWQ